MACLAGIKPINNDLNAAVPVGKMETKSTDYYDYNQLKIIEDSLKKIDARNSIAAVLGTYVPGKIFFGVTIYSNSKHDDTNNVTVKESGRKKNRCLLTAFDLAKVITPCAFDRSHVYVGVRYIDDNFVQPYFGTIMSLTRPGNPCTFAFSLHMLRPFAGEIPKRRE